MSLRDVDRFARDIKTNPRLVQELRNAAGGMGLAGIVVFAKAKGFDVTAEEVRDYIRSKTVQVLSDDRLDAIAGGRDKGSTVSVSNVVDVTNATVETEVTGVSITVTAGIVVVVGAAVVT